MILQEEKNEGLIIMLVDIVQFFDKEDMYNVMQTLHDVGVNKKAARVWFSTTSRTAATSSTTELSGSSPWPIRTMWQDPPDPS